MEKPKAVTPARSGGGSSKAATEERCDVLTVPEVAGKSRARLIAECAIEPTLRNAHVSKTFASGAVTELELSDCLRC